MIYFLRVYFALQNTDERISLHQSSLVHYIHIYLKKKFSYSNVSQQSAILTGCYNTVPN